MNHIITLSNLQNQFWLAITNGHLGLSRVIDESNEFSADQRINVYKTTVRSIQIAALMNTYSVCKQILGEQYFKQIAKKYVQDTISMNPDMNHYGDSFPNFLDELCEEHNELIHYPYLGDLARLEWFYQAAYYAADNLHFDMNVFQKAIDQFGDQSVLSLQGNVLPLCSSYPIYQIWDMHRSGDLDKPLKMLDTPQYLCVFRKNFQVEVVLIDAEVYALLALIKDKKTLLEITKNIAENYNLDRALSYVMQNQWLTIHNDD